ncbi:AraC family transcriptional regulator [Cohnella sp. AR92]|uniref:AraC family transcriptional regulator n=1 Tax=Cohnella sp. AR92 TaxID=648716 RepID=UPI000F8CF56B|nr:AraC family transcriptional regulator [Cohnella sp. AR92]RUS48601.1 AraC family transcriptional regulator [Cohnella sp. AR92]
MEKKATGFASEKLYVLPSYLEDERKSHPLTSDAYITDIGSFPAARYHYRERPQGCDSHIFIYCASGQGWVQTEGNAAEKVAAGSFAFIPMGTPHAYGADEADPWTIYWFHLKGDGARHFVELLKSYPSPISLPAPDERKLLELFHECYELLVSRAYSAVHQAQVSQCVRYLLCLVASAASRREDVRSQGHVDRAIRYMNDRLEEFLTLDELSRQVRLSKAHLIAIFKRETGCAPIDYYLRLKMQRAGQYLDLTDNTIKEVGAAVGFKDPYYFSRLFKRIIGQAPSEYRNRLKG